MRNEKPVSQEGSERKITTNETEKKKQDHPKAEADKRQRAASDALLATKGKMEKTEKKEVQEEKDLLEGIPDGTDLLNGDAVPLIYNKKQIYVQFDNSYLTIDAGGEKTSYKFVALDTSFGDVDLTLSKVAKNDGLLAFAAGAYGQSDEVQCDSAKLKTILTKLISGSDKSCKLNRKKKKWNGDFYQILITPAS